MEKTPSLPTMIHAGIFGSPGTGKYSVFKRIISPEEPLPMQKNPGDYLNHRLALPTVPVSFCTYAPEFLHNLKQGPTSLDRLVTFNRQNRLIILVVDMTNRSSLDLIHLYFELFPKTLPGPVKVVLLVGNKQDLPDHQVTTEELEAIAEQKDCMCTILSAAETGKELYLKIEEAPE